MNRLHHETSPYLRQHAHNPVDWYPWGPEALARARELDRPIFLSIGYSACHWCHVMERESFEDPAIARILAEHFISIKVDREERPDLDAIYMQATLLMNDGQGGWPMSVFLTPDLKPFFAGTYFPPVDGYGRPGFATLLRILAEAYEKRRDDIESSSAEVVDAIARSTRLRTAPGAAGIGPDTVRRAVREWGARFDHRHGGTTGAPKFPPSMHIMLLLRAWSRFADADALAMATATLRHMARGGMHDQLGGGFSRYSVDERWAVPHFEKMLYDNALLLNAYAEGYAATREPALRAVAQRIVAYVAREMTAPNGAFFSSQDADSEGEEGKFFAWTAAEFREVLGADAEFAMRAYGVTEHGNFEHGTTVLSVALDAEELAATGGCTPAEAAARLESCRARLFEARERRIKPFRDEKHLTSWNGLMIWALARAARLAELGTEPLEMAARAADFILAGLVDAEGRVLAVAPAGERRLPGYLDCHAYLAAGLLELAAARGEPRHARDAARIMGAVRARFADPEGGFYFTADDHERLIVRTQDPIDNATPSGNAMAALAALHLHAWTGEDAWRDLAEGTFRAFAGIAERHPSAFPMMLVAADFGAQEPRTVVISGEAAAARELEAAAFAGFSPNTIVALHRGDGDDLALLAGKAPPNAGALAYVCNGRTCLPPIADPRKLKLA